MDGLTVSFEYFLTDLTGLITYHYIVFYDANNPGVIQFYYFAGVSSLLATVVGVQGIRNNGK